MTEPIIIKIPIIIELDISINQSKQLTATPELPVTKRRKKYKKKVNTFVKQMPNENKKYWYIKKGDRTQRAINFAREKNIDFEKAYYELFRKNPSWFVKKRAKELASDLNVNLEPKKDGNLEKAVEYAKKNKCSFTLAYKKLFDYPPNGDMQKNLELIKFTKEEKKKMKKERQWKYQKEDKKMEEWAVKPEKVMCSFCQIREATKGDSCEECHEAFEKIKGNKNET